jgi:hypothetical protein
MVSFEPCFFVHEERCGRMTHYISAVRSALLENPKAVPLFVESTIVLMVAWQEDFLGSVVGTAAHNKQSELREYLVSRGRPEEQSIVSNCDLATLVSIARRQIQIKKRGQAIESIFQRLFGVSAWRTDDSRARFVDLNLLRQIIVHHGGANLGDAYWDQLTDKTLLDEMRYGDPLPVIRRIRYSQALVFIHTIAVELADQVAHLRARLPR